MGRGLAVLGLTPGEEVTEAQLRNLFGERGPAPVRGPDRGRPTRQGQLPEEGVQGRRPRTQGDGHGRRLRLPAAADDLPVVGAGEEDTRRVIEAAHERAIERVLEWIEDEVAVIRYGKDGIYRVRSVREGRRR
ncbi:relaxase domain-containing protein [Streptomyces bottropensis]|uniref:relaxase domain-containing protein n=1 Tax=Streptomyces bottropensis TaxID=42235 RepID=UPI0036A3A4DD